MMRRGLPSLLLLSLSCFASNVLPATIALGEEAPAANTPVANSEAEAPTTPGASIGNGMPIEFSELGITITPPMGWEVLPNRAGMTLVMQEPKAPEDPKNIDYSKPIFQRNITVSAMHDGSPIDEAAAKEWQAKLKAQLEKNGLVANLQVLDEHKFFDYRGKNDGLVLYSAFTMNDIPMAQMHVIVSGENNRFLLTYTDLGKEFEANQDAFGKAWASMVSIDVTGVAPGRYDSAILYGSIAGVILILFGAFVFLRRRAAMNAYQSEGDGFIDDDSTTSSIHTLAPRKVAKAKVKAKPTAKPKKAKSQHDDVDSNLGDEPLTQSGMWDLASDDGGDDLEFGEELESGVSSL